MSHAPHDLAAEFPDDVQILRHLKASKGHFAALIDRYEEVSEAIHRMEAELKPASDSRTATLKKERLSLVDRIGWMIAAERTAV